MFMNQQNNDLNQFYMSIHNQNDLTQYQAQYQQQQSQQQQQNDEQELPTKSEFQKVNMSQLNNTYQLNSTDQLNKGNRVGLKKGQQKMSESQLNNTQISHQYRQIEQKTINNHSLINDYSNPNLDKFITTREYQQIKENIQDSSLEDNTLNFTSMNPTNQVYNSKNTEDMIVNPSKSSFDDKGVKVVSDDQIKEQQDYQDQQDNMNTNVNNNNRTNSSVINFDDVPIKPAYQDFNKILEDKLKEESQEQDSMMQISHREKKQYLKKGAKKNYGALMQRNTSSSYISDKHSTRTNIQSKKVASSQYLKQSHCGHHDDTNKDDNHNHNNEDEDELVKSKMDMSKYIDDEDDNLRCAIKMNMSKYIDDEDDNLKQQDINDISKYDEYEQQFDNHIRQKQVFNQEQEWINQFQSQEKLNSGDGIELEEEQKQKKVVRSGCDYNVKVDGVSEEQVLEKKVQELSREIKRLKVDNDRLKMAKKKSDDQQKELKKEVEDVNAMKQQELRKMEQLKENELQRIRKDKKQIEQKLKGLQSIQNAAKKEKEEMEILKNELKQVKEQFTKHKSSSKIVIEKLKKQNDELLNRNEELLNKNVQLNTKLQQCQQQRLGRKGNEKQNVRLLKNKQLHEYAKEEVIDQEIDSEEMKDGSKEIIHEEEEDEQFNYSDMVDNKIQRGFIDQDYSISLEKMDKYYSYDGFQYNKNEFYKKYKQQKQKNVKVVSKKVDQDGRVSKTYENGKREVVYSNGVRREIFADGYMIVQFSNNDVKQTLPDKTVIYYFYEAQTTQTSIPNGANIYWFNNNQLEIHHPDGNKEIRFSDRTEKYIHKEGKEVTFFTDDVVQLLENGIKTLIYPDGQKDVLQSDGSKLKVHTNEDQFYIANTSVVKNN